MSHIVNKNYKTLQNVLLRCPGHFNDYKIEGQKGKVI